MKKIFAVILMLFTVTACQSENIQGNEYQLMDTNSKIPITLAFSKDENRFFGKAVNNYFGSYTLTKKNITFSQVGSTMMMGAPDEMAAEQQYFQDLSTVTGYQVDKNTLTLILKDNKKLIFKKVGTIETN